MLILKFIEPEKRKTLFKRKNNIPFKTSGFICNNTVFNVIELYKKNLNHPDVLSLLNRYKGFVLNTEDEGVNRKLNDYIFNSTPYVKRALLSGVCSHIQKEKSPNLLICDDDFRFSAEWLQIAAYCKKIVITGMENNDMYTFSRYCYNELGLNVFINEKIFVDDDYIMLDMNLLKNRNTVELIGQTRKTVYPDSKYFECNQSAYKLMSFGASKESACAAVQVVPFKKIYISAE